MIDFGFAIRRRTLVGGLMAAAALTRAGTAGAAVAPAAPEGTAADLARNTAYWDEVRKLYAVTGEITNLENGYWGIMAEPVRREYQRLTDMVNRDNSFMPGPSPARTWRRCARLWPPRSARRRRRSP